MVSYIREELGMGIYYEWRKGFKRRLDTSKHKVHIAVHVAVAAVVSMVSIFGFVPVALADPYEAPVVTITGAVPNPTNGSTDVSWEADKDGTYTVVVGGTSCADGTSVESGGYYANQSMQTTVPAGSLAEGANTIRVCVTTEESDEGSDSVDVVKDTAAPFVTINSVTPNPTYMGTTINWQSNEDGAYSIRSGSSDCSNGTEIENGLVLADIPVDSVLDASVLSEGVNAIRICVVDAATNVGYQTTAVVQDTTAPTITLIGDNPYQLPVGQLFFDPGATLSDNLDPDQIISGDASALDINTPGEYPVYYTGTDSAGNAATPVTRTVVVDDMDNSSTADENAGPNGGDANNDGIPDSAQPQVTSVHNPVTNTPAAIETNSDCTNTNVYVTPESANAVQDAAYDYPAGMMHFTINCYINEEEESNLGWPITVNITQYFYGVSGDFVLRKYNTQTNTYTTVPDAGIGQTVIDGQTVTYVTYAITDGGAFDEDGEVNGVIVDPVGLAVVAQQTQPAVTETPTTPANVTPAMVATRVAAPNTGYEPQSDGSSWPVAGIALFTTALVAVRMATRRRPTKEYVRYVSSHRRK